MGKSPQTVTRRELYDLVWTVPGRTLAQRFGEVAAIVLILIPKATLVGAFLGAAIMLGAIASHFVRPVGLEGDAGAMFPLAIVTFIAGSRPRSSGGSGG